jgi:hypothetical protein
VASTEESWSAFCSLSSICIPRSVQVLADRDLPMVTVGLRRNQESECGTSCCPSIDVSKRINFGTNRSSAHRWRLSVNFNIDHCIPRSAEVLFLERRRPLNRIREFVRIEDRRSLQSICIPRSVETARKPCFWSSKVSSVALESESGLTSRVSRAVPCSPSSFLVL